MSKPKTKPATTAETGVTDEQKQADAAAKQAEKDAKAAAAAEAKAKKDAESAAKKEAAAAEAQAKKDEREAAKAAKLKEKEDKKAAVEAEKAAKIKAKEDAKAAKEANRQPEQNGVRRPGPDGLCGRVWGLADKLSADLGQPVPVADLLKAGEADGLNPANIRTEYARWKKFHGLAGRIVKPETAAPAA